MTYPYNFDIVQEIKDKEKSALKVLEVKRSIHKNAKSKGQY